MYDHTQIENPSDANLTPGLKLILDEARQCNASDVHLVRGMAPVFRINGEIQARHGMPLDETLLQALLDEVLSPEHRETFEQKRQLCFSRRWEDVGHCRITVYHHAGCPEISIRLGQSRICSLQELGLPTVVNELVRLPHGLVLVTGPTGVGKTTTLNYMIDAINRRRRAKIVTIEDPVEYVHQNARGIVIQQEVASDVHSFRDAVVHVLRQDPDVIVIGEMRDLETMETALTAAETGHLVLATLHTPDVVQTVQRIYSVFPAGQQNAIVIQLANSLQAILSLKLLPRADGNGRVLACEVCVATPAVRNVIREQNSHQLLGLLQTGSKQQMQTMDNSLLELYQKGQISFDAALSNAREPDFIRRRTTAVTV